MSLRLNTSRVKGDACTTQAETLCSHHLHLVALLVLSHMDLEEPQHSLYCLYAPCKTNYQSTVLYYRLPGCDAMRCKHVNKRVMRCVKHTDISSL